MRIFYTKDFVNALLFDTVPGRKCIKAQERSKVIPGTLSIAHSLLTVNTGKLYL